MALRAQLLALRDDVRAIFRNDPAARSLAEVLLYPGLHAITLHRFAHALWLRRVPFLPRLISQLGRFTTGIEIHPGATIGHGFFIDHGMGVVIGETAEIGNWVTLYQGVTLGGTGKQRGKRHPTLEDHVTVGVGAIVLGAITLGEGAKIGGGAVVVKDVPPHSTAVGVPARIVITRDPATGAERRVESLPDPEGQMLRGLRLKVLELEERLTDVEVANNQHHMEHHLSFDALPDQLWASLGDNSARDEEYMLGAGI
ncbi:MAG TPA: serine O-acetyltransferase [Kouleothrix sp.]|uniref:serine O-acetyltransferase EpsC n=1 Tax=Kouleothrix sp. TaxID=2779161 RepID=UPI002C47C769|nr:serine O-acetyltransferase [Kouleothrix sp.]HRC74523.1 serine O-acetyltransferase [Kouleothrix sp.]